MWTARTRVRCRGAARPQQARDLAQGGVRAGPARAPNHVQRVGSAAEPAAAGPGEALRRAVRAAPPPPQSSTSDGSAVTAPVHQQHNEQWSQRYYTMMTIWKRGDHAGSPRKRSRVISSRVQWLSHYCDRVTFFYRSPYRSGRPGLLVCLRVGEMAPCCPNARICHTIVDVESAVAACIYPGREDHPRNDAPALG